MRARNLPKACILPGSREGDEQSPCATIQEHPPGAHRLGDHAFGGYPAILCDRSVIDVKCEMLRGSWQSSSSPFFKRSPRNCKNAISVGCVLSRSHLDVMSRFYAAAQ